MIKHIVLFCFKSGLTNEAYQEFMRQFELLSQLSCVSSFSFHKETCSYKYEYVALFEFRSKNLLSEFNSSNEHSLFLQKYWGDAVSDFEVYDLCPMERQ
jgi:hypothetical protein